MTDKSVVTTKELNPGIILHKVVTPGSEGIECTYEFKVELQKLNTLEFTIDLEGSKNIELEDGDGLIKNTVIEAFETKTVAVVKMFKHWSLKSKFRFMLKSAPRGLQERYLARESAQVLNLIEKAEKVFAKVSMNAPMNQIEKILKNNDINFVDLEFPPNKFSIYSSIEDYGQEQLVHWRRPKDFMQVDYSRGLLDPSIFADEVEPSDIRQGQLGDSWFMCALASLSERPALVQRLFVTKHVSGNGLYRVKLCKNGEWVTVTVDDYFPCYPMGGPIFSQSSGNELWVLVLEKAYAKLHGNYYLLKGGLASEGLIDLTGCPCLSYNLSDEQVQKKIESGELWLMMKDYEETGYLLTASTPGEERWNESNYMGTLSCGLIPGHSYAIITCKQVKGQCLINFRNPWGKIEWKGDWSEKSDLWSMEMRNALRPVFDEEDSNFWMSYDDFIDNFSSLNVCAVKNWDEVRIKGKFVRVQDKEDPDLEVAVSKWYYSIELGQPKRIYIGIHQEDERVFGVSSRRSCLDIGIVILKKMPDGTLTLLEKSELAVERQNQLEVSLGAGSYIVLPVTSGCLLRRPPEAPREKVNLTSRDGELTPIARSTIDDIFRKFDMLLNSELSYTEFKGFYECIGRTISEVEFKQKILKRYCNTDSGITLQGFRDFFRDQIRTNGYETICGWLELLGYDEELYSVRSRCFVLTFHSESEIAVTVRDAVQTDLDNRANILLIEKYGTELENRTGVRCFYHFSKATHCYSYGLYNEQAQAIEVTLDCSASENMLFSAKIPLVKKRIEAGQLEFMMHSMAVPSVESFVRSAKVSWQPA